MSVIDQLISLVAPHECIGCGAENSLLCMDCATRLPAVSPRCYVCVRPTANGAVCCQSPLDQTKSAVAYAGLVKDLLWGLKSGGMQAAVKPMAMCMKKYTQTGSILVPVPTANVRVRQRGYDQAVLLARELSRQTGLPFQQLLIRSGAAHQVGANRIDRKRQLATAYRAKSALGLRVILIDDVMTTGATLEAAATALRAAGATKVSALTFARA